MEIPSFKFKFSKRNGEKSSIVVLVARKRPISLKMKSCFFFHLFTDVVVVFVNVVGFICRQCDFLRNCICKLNRSQFKLYLNDFFFQPSIFIYTYFFFSLPLLIMLFGEWNIYI